MITNFCYFFRDSYLFLGKFLLLIFDPFWDNIFENSCPKTEQKTNWDAYKFHICEWLLKDECVSKERVQDLDVHEKSDACRICILVQIRVHILEDHIEDANPKQFKPRQIVVAHHWNFLSLILLMHQKTKQNGTCNYCRHESVPPLDNRKMDFSQTASCYSRNWITQGGHQCSKEAENY